MKDINFATTELTTAATLTNTTLTNTAGEKENIIRELTTKQEQQDKRITQHQDQQMDKMLESFQKFVREMMSDMFTQISSQMNSLLTSLLPMITNTYTHRNNIHIRCSTRLLNKFPFHHPQCSPAAT